MGHECDEVARRPGSCTHQRSANAAGPLLAEAAHPIVVRWLASVVGATQAAALLTERRVQPDLAERAAPEVEARLVDGICNLIFIGSPRREDVGRQVSSCCVRPLPPAS